MKNSKAKMDYIEIFKNAGQITWQNKFLWWLGLVASFSGGVFYLGGNVGSQNKENSGKNDIPVDEFVSFVLQYQEWIVAGFIIIFVILIGLFMIRTWGRSALIYSLKEIKEKRDINFSLSMKKGKRFFWKLLGLNILIKSALLIILVVLFIPPAFLLVNEKHAVGSLLTLMAGTIFFFVAMLAYFIRQYGQLYIVLGKIGIVDSLENSYGLFKKNIISSCIVFALFIPASLLTGVLVILFWLLSSMLFGIFGIILYFILNKVGMVILTFIYVLLFIVMMLAVRSIYESFFQTVWFLFFEEISKPKKDNEKVADDEIIKKQITETEGVKISNG